MDVTLIPSRLRAAREKCGLSIEVAAGTIECDVEDWQAWEDGTKEPSFRDAVKASVLLRIDPFWLVGHER